MSVSSANRYRFADEKAAEVRRQDAHLVYLAALNPVESGIGEELQ